MIRKAHKQRNGAAGDIIYAENAEPGKRYFCTMCGVGLHLMTRNGVSFFVCYPDTEHGDPYCRKLSSQDKRPHSMEKFDKDAFFSHILREQQKRTGGHGPAGGTKKGGVPGKESVPGEQNEDEKPVSTLEQMWQEGYIYMGGLTHLGSGRLQDTLISNKSANIWRRGKVTGTRVIQCRVDGIYAEGKKLFLKCLYHSEHGLDKKLLVLHFRDDEAFDAVRAKLYRRKEMDNGTMRTFVPKWILLAANWEDYCPPGCKKRCSGAKYSAAKCRNCYGRMEGEFINQRQIYAPEEPSNWEEQR